MKDTAQTSLTLVAAAQTGCSSDWFASTASPAFRAMPPPLPTDADELPGAHVPGRQAVATDHNRGRRTLTEI